MENQEEDSRSVSFVIYACGLTKPRSEYPKRILGKFGSVRNTGERVERLVDEASLLGRYFAMSHPKVLVVEDEPSIAETLEYSLQSEGFAVQLAGTGGDGLTHFSETPPDFIILDVGLPDISGFEVCREIRKTSNVPVLFLTARESEIDRVVGLEIGADDYVVKPFSPRELVARVRAILRRSQNQSMQTGGETIQVGDLQLDCERVQAHWQKTSLNLSRYEFGLLKVFMQHPGRVYTRDQLMELVWDEPDSSLDRTVDAHIKSLRAKLRDAAPDLEAIMTHRGIGYSLREEL